MNIKLAFTLLLFLLPTTAIACGGFFCQLSAPVIQSGEAIVFGVKGNNVTMHVQIQYEGPSEGFSWVLPLPFQPKVSVGSEQLFSALSTTLPQFVLEIQQEPTETCTAEDLEPDSLCMAVADSSMLPPAQAPGGATVLEEGSIGPFDFVVLEAADNDPSSVFRWLEEFGYDQPDEAAPLMNYYASLDHVFVALKLRKNAEVGEIQPLILEYQMPPDEESDTPLQVSRRAMACVPIQLTRIAATNNMPITVYTLGDFRAVPLNFIELELDDNQVNWFGCSNGGPICYDTDYRDRFDRAALEINNQTFVTEYAGTARVMDGLISIAVTREEIANVKSQQEFFDTISFLLPNIPLVNTILNDYMGETFNASALAEELHEKLLQPALDDQKYVDSFDYLTRLYARLSPEMMSKDPFFAFRPELGDVSNIHRATGRPVCTQGELSGVEITVESTKESFVVPAAVGSCGNWVPADSAMPMNVSLSPALQVASYGFSGDDGVIVLRSEDGTFDKQKVEEAVRFGDSLVISQEIPEYFPPLSAAPSVSATPTTIAGPLAPTLSPSSPSTIQNSTVSPSMPLGDVPSTGIDNTIVPTSSGNSTEETTSPTNSTIDPDASNETSSMSSNASSSMPSSTPTLRSSSTASPTSWVSIAGPEPEPVSSGLSKLQIVEQYLGMALALLLMF
jgi:hypothetical protein